MNCLRSCTVPTKKLRTIESHEDRISNLPDGIISDILSRMPTKDAVQTCVLSKDWKFKWTSIDTIDIDTTTTMTEEVEITSFVSFVDRVLDLTRGSRDSSLRLILPKNQEIDKSPDHLTRWISQAARRGFRNLGITADLTLRVNLTQCLADFTSLTNLYIVLSCEVELPVNNCFPCLKGFYLCCGKGREVRILEKQYPKTGQLFLTFPVLENLTLIRCRFFEVELVEIRAPELIKFQEYHSRMSDCTFKIFAPKLNWFKSKGGLLSKYDLYAPSLSMLELDGHHTSSEILASRASAILKRVPNLDDFLSLESPIVNALLEWNEVHKLPTFHRLKHVQFDDCDAQDMLELLGLMPNVETLECISCNYEYCYDQEKPLPRCITSSLKELVFDYCPDDSGNLDMIKLVLMKAMKLEEVYLDPGVEAEMRRLLSTLEPERTSRIVLNYFPSTCCCCCNATT